MQCKSLWIKASAKCVNVNVNGSSLSNSDERRVFSCRLKIVRDPAFRIGVGRSFHQPGTVNENVLESNFEPVCGGTMRRRSYTPIRKHQCLELNVSHNRQPVQGDKERCNMGSFGLVEDHSCCCIIYRGLIVLDGSPARRALQ